MEVQFLGLLCLLVGIGSVFFLWAMALKERSATSELPVEAPEKPQAHTDVRKRSTNHSLTPIVVAKDSASPSSPATVKVETPDEFKEAASDAPAPEQDEADPMASTHLEIANQFFQMGDFEGASDMCKLVLENPDASPLQVESATLLHAQC